MIDPETIKLLEKQHYKIAGRHSAVKICHWTKMSIKDEGYCYKQKFYGISSHRCLQMTPSVLWCTQRCVFCWRNIERTIGTELKEYDDPSDIIDEAIEKQRVLLSGFGGIPDRINKEKFKEAQDPNQAAISLSGEPTIYPGIDELIGEFHRRNFTTFLVTNGTLPERLENMDNLPTQLYLSIDAPDKKVYKKLCNPIIPNGWEKINRTIDLFPSLKTRRVIRITLVKGMNMDMNDVGGYARLIERSGTDFIEVKSYMFVGGSRMRLSLDNMPSFSEVMEFSKALGEELGYVVSDSKEDSRVVLLSREK